MLRLLSFVLAGTLMVCACAPVSRPGDSGYAPVYEDPNTSGQLSGIGVESQDVSAMTNTMVTGMLQNPLLTGRQRAVRVILDSKYFNNQSSTRTDKDLITDQLRVELNRAAQGRIIFLAREYSDVVNEEREMKRTGELSKGTIGLAKAQAGADFRLVGRMTSQDSLNVSTGLKSRYHQFVFEMIDLETSGIIWNDKFEFKKTGQDDVVYR